MKFEHNYNDTVRLETATIILAGMFAHNDIVTASVKDQLSGEMTKEKSLARNALDQADALLAELTDGL